MKKLIFLLVLIFLFSPIYFCICLIAGLCEKSDRFLAEKMKRIEYWANREANHDR